MNDRTVGESGELLVTSSSNEVGQVSSHWCFKALFTNSLRCGERIKIKVEKFAENAKRREKTRIEPGTDKIVFGREIAAGSWQ